MTFGGTPCTLQNLCLTPLGVDTGFLSHRSALQHPEFVAQAISQLLANGCIVEHSVSPFCVNPLSVAKGMKLRLVIDPRHVNSFLVRFRFKCADLRSLSQVLESGTGSLHGTSSQGITMLISAWSIRGISVCRGSSMASLRCRRN